MYTYKIHCFIRDAFKFKVSKRANNYNIISQKVPTKINHFCQSQLHHPFVPPDRRTTPYCSPDTKLGNTDPMDPNTVAPGWIY